MREQIIKNGDSTISLLKKARKQIFSYKDEVFGWNNIFTIKFLRDSSFVRNKIDFNSSHLDSLVSTFESWCKIPTYLTFLDKNNVLNYFLASKRGNQVYERYLNRKLNSHLSFMKCDGFSKWILRNKKGFRSKISNVAFITLTCSIKKYGSNRLTAWLKFEHDYNIFVTRLRKHYGKCWIMKSVESTKKGYPHIHLLVMTEKSFDVFKPKRLKCKNRDCGNYFNIDSNHWFVQCPHCLSRVSHPYRSVDNSLIKRFWSSNIDVLVPDPSGMEKGCGVGFMKDYIFKDMLKSFSYKSNRSYQNSLSLAMGWLFGKRSYSVSKKGVFSDLITDSCITQTQIKEIIQKNPKKELVFIGLTDFQFFNGGRPPPRSFKIQKEDCNYSEYFKGVYGFKKKEVRFIMSDLLSSNIFQDRAIYVKNKKSSVSKKILRKTNCIHCKCKIIIDTRKSGFPICSKCKK